MLDSDARQSQEGRGSRGYWSALIHPGLLHLNDYNHYVMYQRSLHVMNSVIQIHNQHIQDMIQHHLASAKRPGPAADPDAPKPKRQKVQTSTASKESGSPGPVASLRSDATTPTPTSGAEDPIPFRPHSDITTSRLGGKGARSQRKKWDAGVRRRADPEGSPLSLCSDRGEPSRAASPTRAVGLDGEEEGPATRLFPEVLTGLFSYLDLASKGRVAQVCSKWRDAAYQKSVWRGTEAKLHLRTTSATLFPSLVRRGIRRVQVLSLRKSLRDLVVGMPHLESLNLSGCYNVSETALEHAFKSGLPHLKELNVSLCKEVSDACVNRFVRCCRSLEVLDLGGCSKISNLSLYVIAFGLKNLRKLNLRSCRQINDYGIGHLTGHSDPEGQTSGAPSLEDLSLQDCQKISDKALKYLSQGLPSLTKVNLSFCVSITDSGLKCLAKSPQLREINLCSCDNVSDVGLGYLARASEFSEQNARRAEFTSLDVSFCNNVSDAGMKHVASGLTRLRVLSVANCAVSDASLSKIAAALTLLEVLNIGQCTQVSDASVDQVAKHLTHLRHIDLYGCTKVTEAALEKLRKLPNLKKITQQLWPDN